MLTTLLLAHALAAPTPLPDVQTRDPSFVAAQARVVELAQGLDVAGRAKNVILFIGDGMGIATLTAARIYEGQRKGGTGEDNLLSFEAFPYSALVRTYNVDKQIPDSAGTASALNTGVKTRLGVVNTPPGVPRGDCAAQQAQGGLVPFGRLAHDAGKRTGTITTTRLTHATPAATFAVAASRAWEAPDPAYTTGMDPCTDIATQLVTSHLDLALGGGREMFVPKERGGVRTDGVDLLARWREAHPTGLLALSGPELALVAPDAEGPVLGLFAPSHLPYLDRRVPGSHPSLPDLVRTAIPFLERDPDGYFLMVEAGRIDHAHHEGLAHRALAETVELSDAVRAALELVDLDRTLLLVTADHDHTMTVGGGHPDRGSDIVGWIVEDGQVKTFDDGRPMPTLTYADGPGAALTRRNRNPRVDPTALDYHQPAIGPSDHESHGAHDVALYAIGAGAQLFHGNLDQSVIFHAMAHAMGWDLTSVGPPASAPPE